MQRQNKINDGATKTDKLPDPGAQSSSVLQMHSVQLDKSVIMFHVYYAASTPVYYELMPFVQRMNFADPDAMLASVPSEWTCLARQLRDDKLFEDNKIDPSTVFGEQCAIAYLTSLLGKDALRVTRYLHDAFLRRIESDRVRVLQEQLDAFKKATIHTHGHHRIQIDMIRAGLESLMGHQKSILQTMMEVVARLTALPKPAVP